jgi:hypothetical protein
MGADEVIFLDVTDDSPTRLGHTTTLTATPVGGAISHRPGPTPGRSVMPGSAPGRLSHTPTSPSGSMRLC